MRKLFAIILALLVALPLAAADLSEENVPDFLQGLGFAAGHYSGVGMSYKLIYKGKLGAQITGGYYSDGDGDRWGMPGLELQYYLARNRKTSFYISTGVSFEYNRNEYYYWYPEGEDDGYEEQNVEIDEIWTTGIGMGMEALLLEGISVCVEPIMYYRDNGRASVMVQGAIHYYFNLD